ncbi:FimV/HubP family polar landmark protein [Polynucleobacter brandtiae]|uniref:FimV/HubP family polar landmark protein n=1 Tax=Polynucleobacter brandtiae TaxID=1938816 RepID=UPI001E577217|nr:FimV/HubP family polar landmark protein [Polynucleobacter brandtiae]
MPKLFSKAGEPLKVEFPIKVGSEEQSALASLSIVISSKSSYDRLGISQKILELNPQAMIYRNKQDQLMALVETVSPVPNTDDPFLDLLVTVSWSSGSITKTYTLLLGDAQKITVKPGQTASEIASQLAPQLGGTSIDQTMLALFRANPDAFASGSINRLEAGVELVVPSQALLRSISPAEANQFAAQSNARWLAERDSRNNAPPSSLAPKNADDESVKDRLRIGSNVQGNSDEQRFTEDLVAQEKVLEQTRARVAELEKNIVDLQLLLNQSKEKLKNQSASNSTSSDVGLAPALLTLSLMIVTALLLWFLAKNARRQEARDFSQPNTQTFNNLGNEASATHGLMPERAKALFAGIDLDLSSKPIQTIDPDVNPLADALRVKLNLARAYITIEDFNAAKKSLHEIVSMGATIDPAIVIEAQGLLVQLSHRQS